MPNHFLEFVPELHPFLESDLRSSVVDVVDHLLACEHVVILLLLGQLKILPEWNLLPVRLEELVKVFRVYLTTLPLESCLEMPGWNLTNEHEKEELIEGDGTITVHICNVHHVVNFTLVLRVEGFLVNGSLEIVRGHRSEEIGVCHTV